MALAAPAGAAVIVNDRADIARMAGADGVHVGQDDLWPSAVRDLVGDEAVIGLSTHSDEQVTAAIERAGELRGDWPRVRHRHQGDRLRASWTGDASDPAAARVAASGLPLVAIGGITLAQAAAVIDAGARSVAVITDLLTGGDPAGRVRDFLRALR